MKPHAFRMDPRIAKSLGLDEINTTFVGIVFQVSTKETVPKIVMLWIRINNRMRKYREQILAVTFGIHIGPRTTRLGVLYSGIGCSVEMGNRLIQCGFEILYLLEKFFKKLQKLEGDCMR